MSILGAREFTESQGGGTMNYGVLNGEYMTVYVDQYGHLGPQQFSGGLIVARSTGTADAISGYPSSTNIGSATAGQDGRIEPTANPPTYAVLRSLTDRSIEETLRVAIIGRRELLTVGGGNVCATWGVISSHVDLAAGVNGTDGGPNAFSVSGATASGALSATSVVMLYDSLSADLLEVTNVVSFQNDTSAIEKVRIKYSVTLRNAHATDTISNLTYGFGIDPNPNISTGSTSNYFMSVVDTDAFAVEASSTGTWTVALAVYETAGEDFILGYTTTISEAVLTRDFDGSIAADRNIRLGTGTNADLYNGNVLTSSTTNFKTDAAWRAALPTSSGAYAIYLRTPEYSLTPGETQTFDFYVITGPEVAATTAAGTRGFAYVS